MVSSTTYNIVKSIEGNLLGLDNTTKTAAGTNYPIGDYAPYLTGRDFQGLRLFPLGFYGFQGNDYKEGVRISHTDVFDDFLGAALDTFKWNANKGSNGSTATAFAIANNGTHRLTTGVSATVTMAVNGAQIAGALNFLVSDAGLRYEAKLGKISALTSQSICFGLVDVTTLSAPFTLSTATVTANGTNGAAFLQDSAGTNTHLNAVAVNAGGTPQVVALTQDVDTAAFHRYRIEIDASGNALYFIDGVLVATILLAVATTAVLAPSVSMFARAASASQTLDIDYLLTQKTRLL